MMWFQTPHLSTLIVAILKTAFVRRAETVQLTRQLTPGVSMPKSFNFTVQRISPIENNEGRIIGFMIDGIANQGKRMEAVRVEMDHASWLKISCALSKKGNDHDKG